MAKESAIFRPVFVSFRPTLAAKKMMRAVFGVLPLGAKFAVAGVALGMLVAGCTATTISADLHSDIIFGLTKRSRTLSDGDKFYGALWLGLCASFLLAAVTSYWCDKLRWAVLVPIAYLAGFLLIGAWWFGGF